MGKEKIEFIPVKIFREGKHQMAIRFPLRVIKALDIDPEKDLFIFSWDKENIHLTGEIVDKEKYEEEEVE